MKNPEEVPAWFTTGRTTLVPKKQPTEEPSNYRPITCLPIIYKIMTNMITKRMKEHMMINNLIPEEQKGCMPNTLGTIDQLLIDKMILEDAKKNKKDLSVAWIDYRKAFDSIPHDWLIESLNIHRFDDNIINFFKYTMKNWKTTLNINSTDTTINTSEVNINTGIFQGDSPSGLHFIICLLPLSWLLNQSKIGYTIGKSKTADSLANHLLFMDDLKLFTGNDNQLNQLLTIVKMFSDDIRMSFGLDKCNKLTIKRGEVVESPDIIVQHEKIKDLNNTGFYKYLGVEESNNQQLKIMKSKLRHEYFNRIKKILKTKLNGQNLIQAINTYAVPAVTYGFPVLDWSVTELEIINRETRNILKTSHVIHNKSDVTRLYLPRSNGGRGLINILDQYKKCIINTSHYINNNKERLIKVFNTWDIKRGEKSINVKAKKYANEIGLNITELFNMTKQQTKQKIKTSQIQRNINDLEKMEMHGQYFRELNKPHINKELSLLWNKSTKLKATTESTICAIQEQAITTRYIEKNIHKTSNTDICRICNIHKETIHHIISGCPTLAPTKYLERHNNVAKYIYLATIKHHNLHSINIPWYTYKPQPVLENNEVKLLWDYSIQTDHKIDHNKPDILILDKMNKSLKIIDVAIPTDKNIANKRAEKIQKYTNLAVELKELWHLKSVSIIPIIISATGLIHNKFKEDINKIGVKLDVREMQKITLLGTAGITRSFFTVAN